MQVVVVRYLPGLSLLLNGDQPSVRRSGRTVAGISILAVGGNRAHGINASGVAQYLVAERSDGGASY